MIKGERRAPRFRAFVEHTEGGLFMLRTEWERLLQFQDELIEIDIAETPLGSIAFGAKVVASFAERRVNGVATITIVREDPRDAPMGINLDRYEVLENLRKSLDYDRTVISADTDDNTALRSFIDDYVLIVPADKGPDHHLPAIPVRYAAILKAPGVNRSGT